MNKMILICFMTSFYVFPLFAQTKQVKSKEKLEKNYQRYEEILDKTLEFLASNPEVEAIKSFKSKDTRFLGIMSWGVTTPGISDQKIREDYGVRILKGTSDVIMSDKVELIMELAPYFCKRYNKRMFSLIAEYKIQPNQGGSIHKYSK